MSEQTDPPADPEAGEPIDADFEPAPEEPSRIRKALSGGPGWLGTIVLSLMAAGLGGVIGLTGGMLQQGPQPAAAIDVDAALEPVTDRQKKLFEQIERTARDVQKLRDELSAEIAALPSVEPGEVSLPEDLEERLGRLSTRLNEMASLTRLESLESKVDVLESVGDDGQASAQEVVRAVSSLEARLDTLETDLDDARTELTAASTASSRDIDKLMTLIEEMRREEAAARSVAAAADASADAALALSAIEAASRHGRPFESEYRMLLAALPKNTTVRELEMISADGAPTLSELQASFAAPLRVAKAAIPGEESGLGWLDRLFGDAVTVRRVEGESSSLADALEAAEKTLAAGDLEQTLGLLEPLEGPVGEAFADWTGDAKKRITLEAALEALRLDLIVGGGQDTE